MNKSFVDMAVTIHERALSIPEVVEVVRDIDNFLGSDSPFSKITVMHASVTKGRARDNIIWAFCEMHDHLKSSELCSGDLAVRTVLGEAGGRGFIDFMLIHKVFKDYLLGPVLPIWASTTTSSKRCAVSWAHTRPTGSTSALCQVPVHQQTPHGRLAGRCHSSTMLHSWRPGW